MKTLLGISIGFSGAISVALALFVGHDPGAQAASGDTVADRVYGQFGSFTSSNQNCGYNNSVTANSLCSPQSVVIDSLGRLWVSDSDNNRVLEYDTPLSSSTPNRVFGQGNSFTTGACNGGGVSASSLCYPAQIAVDAGRNLWVADDGNHRVLEYDDPIGTNNTVADRVFGQFNSFTTNVYNNGGTSANSLWNPTGVAIDSNGNVYVADRYNYRVLEYDVPLSSDTVADRVLGQAGNLNSGVLNNGGVSANSLASLLGVEVDASDNLYVADEGNNRVLKYIKPISTDLTADVVFGQGGSFTSNTANNGGIGAASNYITTGITTDSGGNVYISETGNERVLEYDTPPNTDTIADQVFGHNGSFTLGTNDDIGLNASSLADAWDVAIDSACHLWIADMGNNRVLEYDSPPPSCAIAPTFTPTATVCPLSVCTATPTSTVTNTPTITPTATATPNCPPAGPICTPTPTPTCDALTGLGCDTDTPTATPIDTDTPTGTPTCDPGQPGAQCETDTPTPVPSDTPTPTATPCLVGGVEVCTATPTSTPTCVAPPPSQCGTDTPTSTATNTPVPTSTPSRTPTATPTPACPANNPTGLLGGTVISALNVPASGTIIVNLTLSGTSVAGTINIHGIVLPTGSIVGVISCTHIRFNTPNDDLQFDGTISDDGSSIEGVYIAHPSENPALRVGDAGSWQAGSTDSDGDGYPDLLEDGLQKNPAVYCPIMRADINMDGYVNGLDLSALARYWTQTVPPAPPRADLNHPTDNSINALDLSVMATQYARTVAACP